MVVDTLAQCAYLLINETGNNKQTGDEMEMTIKSRKMNQTLTFSRPGSEYVYADLNGKSGTLGNQICHGGKTSGSTITYSGDSQEEFEAICRRWYRAYLRHDEI